MTDELNEFIAARQVGRYPGLTAGLRAQIFGGGIGIGGLEQRQELQAAPLQESSGHYELFQQN